MTEDTNVGRRHPPALTRGSLSRLGREGTIIEDFLRHLLDAFSGKPAAHASQHEPGGDDALETATEQQILLNQVFGPRPRDERRVDDSAALLASQVFAPRAANERRVDDAAAILASQTFAPRHADERRVDDAAAILAGQVFGG